MEWIVTVQTYRVGEDGAPDRNAELEAEEHVIPTLASLALSLPTPEWIESFQVERRDLS